MANDLRAGFSVLESSADRAKACAMKQQPQHSLPGGRLETGRAAGVMLCPRCRLPLEGCDHEQGIAWRCARCGGQSLNFSQFRHMVPESGANAIWENATARPDPPRQRTRCPECQADMAAVHFPLHGHEVELDICRQCQRLWLDQQQEADRPLNITQEPIPRPRPWSAALGHRRTPEGSDRAPVRWAEWKRVVIALLVVLLILLTWWASHCKKWLLEP